MHYNPHVVILGGTTFDHIIRLQEFPGLHPQTIHQSFFHEGVGSTGSGKALAMTRLGITNTLYSVVGDDRFGEAIQAYLQNNRVQAIFELDPSGTERHVNLMNRDGERISIFVTQSSEDIKFDEHRLRQLMQNSTMVVLNIISYCRQFIPCVKSSGKPVWTDLHDYRKDDPYYAPFIEAAQYIHLSSDNLDHPTSVMDSFIKKGKSMVICTHGKGGATAWSVEEGWAEVQAVPNIEVVDSNGAGDSFFSAFLWAHMQGKSLKECLAFGAAAGALTVQSLELAHEHLDPDFLKQACGAWYNIK